MASRGGHKTTSDGTDFNSREKIANHYAASATGKSRMKLLMVTHYLLGFGHLARLIPSLLDMLGLTVSLPLPRTPLPGLQEYAWLVSLPSTLLAVSACRRSNSSNLKLFLFILFLSCIIPIIITIASLAPDTVEILMDGTIKDQTLVWDQPFPILWVPFLLFCLMVHCVQIIVGRACLQAWAPRHGKRQ